MGAVPIKGGPGVSWAVGQPTKEECIDYGLGRVIEGIRIWVAALSSAGDYDRLMQFEEDCRSEFYPDDGEDGDSE